MFFFSSFTPPKSEHVISWVVENEDSIRNGSGSYKGQRVTLDSLLTRYDCVMSFIIYTGRTSTPLLFKESEEASSARIRMTALTAVLGWWALFGIMYTPFALFNNLGGGTQMTVAQLLDLAHNPAAKPKQRFGGVPVPLLFMGLIFAIVLVLMLFTFIYGALARAFGW